MREEGCRGVAVRSFVNVFWFVCLFRHCRDESAYVNYDFCPARLVSPCPAYMFCMFVRDDIVVLQGLGRRDRDSGFGWPASAIEDGVDRSR